MKLGVVIIHYNTSADLDRCLESLAAYPPAAEHDVVVVDNASVDAGLDEVRRRYPDVTWVMNPENVGYSRGCNLGMAALDAEYYLVLNPDIVVQPGALDRLLEFADANPRAGMVGPQLLNEDGSIQESCRRFYTFRTLLLRRTFFGKIFPDSATVRRHLMQDFDHRSNRPVDWVLGGCLLVRASAMARTGPMDERFFLYFEDVDWCYRMWQAGFEVQYTPDARFVHKHRRDSAQGRFNKSFWLHLGSLISFYEKWGILVWLLKKWRDPLLTTLWWLLDMVGLTAAFWSAYGLRSAAGGLFNEPLYPASEYVPLQVFAWLLATATFVLTGRYRTSALRNAAPAGQHLRQVGGVGVLLLASSYLGHQEVISRAVLLLFLPLLAVFTRVGEHLLRAVFRRLERGRLSLERTLLVGPPARVGPWLEQARDLVSQGVDVAGYVAEGAEGTSLPPLGGGNVPWLGRPGDLAAIVARYRISQVVFWDGPEPGAADAARWRILAGLRRQRVRLRWHLDAAWLLAAGARPEIFGEALSAVQGGGTGLDLRPVGQRLAGIGAGLMLGLLGLPAWAWLRLVRIRRGGARLVDVAVHDLWGHDPVLRVATDAVGRVLPLPWQWRLAGPLLRGRLGVAGPRPRAGSKADAPRNPAEILGFWQAAPVAPGLTGAWRGARRDILAGLWHDPGGFGVLDADQVHPLNDPTPAESGRDAVGGSSLSG